MTQSKVVMLGIRTHQKERKDTARYRKRRTVRKKEETDMFFHRPV
jgi:hypothetical protein